MNEHGVRPAAQWQLLHADHARHPRTPGEALRGRAAWNLLIVSMSLTAELNQARQKIHDGRRLDPPVESVAVCYKANRKDDQAVAHFFPNLCVTLTLSG